MSAAFCPGPRPDSPRPSRRRVLGLGLAAASGSIAGCADSPDPEPVAVPHQRPTAATPAPSVTPQTLARQPRPAAPVKGNQLGDIPVLMHHRLTSDVQGEYDMTPAYFRAELERLYAEKYYPIRTIDLVRRNLAKVPAGWTPVVLTFDDSTPGQFGYDGRGRVDPTTAVGMLLDFHAKHPEFPAVASFYLNRNPFGLTGSRIAPALAQLHKLGFELGNHTWSHPNLRHLSPSGVEAELGRLAAMVTAAVPSAPPRTVALPLGIAPSRRSTLLRGGRGTNAYRTEGVLLVGAGPAKSPFHPEFDPYAIPRIRCTSHGGGTQPLLLDYWLDRLGQRRYRAGSQPPDPAAGPRVG